jgi:hypothetical protein
LILSAERAVVSQEEFLNIVGFPGNFMHAKYIIFAARVYVRKSCFSQGMLVWKKSKYLVWKSLSDGFLPTREF